MCMRIAYVCVCLRLIYRWSLHFVLCESLLYSCSDLFVFVLLLLSIGFNGNALVVDIYLCALCLGAYFCSSPLAPSTTLPECCQMCIICARKERVARRRADAAKIMCMMYTRSKAFVCRTVLAVCSTVFVILSAALASAFSLFHFWCALPLRRLFSD